jgi:peptidoglycan-associated lipoprotein
MKTRRVATPYGLLIAILLILSACSSTQKSQEEPSISPAGDGATPDAAAAPAGPGDAGQTSSELKTIYFPFDSATLTSTAVSDLKANAAYLRANPSVNVQIEGHCDERGSVEYNLALGERRATAGRNYLKKLGISAKRMSTISYGKERPQEMGHDESAWAKNRRDTFVVTGG